MSKRESPEDETLDELTSHFDPPQCREGDCTTTLRWLVVGAGEVDIIEFDENYYLFGMKSEADPKTHFLCNIREYHEFRTKKKKSETGLK